MAKKASKRRNWTKDDIRSLRAGARRKAPARKVARSPKGRARTIGAKKVYHSDGTVDTVYTVRVGSKTFDSDLHHAFTKSIAKARRENKQKLGVRDYSAEPV